MKTTGRLRRVVRYSEAFKLRVVRELEDGGVSFSAMQRRYDIRGGQTVQKWVTQYGNGTRGKVIRVEEPKEINERAELKRRVKALERALADAHLDLAIERSCVAVACKRAGIADVGEFKKKVAGPSPMGR